jgi:dTDP-4-dehydrorhamnose reductase
MARRVLILGASGFIGTYLTEHLVHEGHTVTGTYHGRARPGLVHLDLLDRAEIDNTLLNSDPDVVVLLSGTKDVSRCEKDPVYAVDLNFQTVRNFVESCARNNKAPQIIFFSTDYVFDGVKGAYRSGDPIGARTVYGLTNVLAERILQCSGLQSLVLRVSAVMGRSGGFFNWLETRLKRDEAVDLFENTFFSPTSIGRVCRFVAQTVSEGVHSYRVCHLSDGYRMSRYQYGLAVAGALGKPASLVVPVTADTAGSHFQPDLSLLPDGMTAFRCVDSWDESGNIY